jgi:hypothetical protein
VLQEKRESLTGFPFFSNDSFLRDLHFLSVIRYCSF